MKTKLITIGIWVLTIIGVFFYAKSRYKTDIPKGVTVNVPYSVPKYITDPNGVTHAQFNSVTVSRDLYKHELDSIKQIIHAKNVTGITDFVTNTDLKLGGDTVYVHDTLYGFTKNDGYLSLKGAVTPSNWQLDLSLIDTLHTVTYEKAHIFSPNETIVDISNSNPYVYITSGRSVSIEQKRPIITIGPYVGYQVYPKEQFSVGISIQHPFITIK